MQRISAQNVVDLLLDAVCIVDANSQVVYVSHVVKIERTATQAGGFKKSA